MTPNEIILRGLDAIHGELHVLNENWGDIDHKKLHVIINGYRVIQGEPIIEWEKEEAYMYYEGETWA